MISPQRQILTKIYLASLLIRCVVFVALLTTIGVSAFSFGDTIGYRDIAQHLIEGHGFSLTDKLGNPVSQDFRPPLYPLLLAGSLLLTNGVMLFIVIQLLLVSAIPVFTYLLGKEFVSDRASIMLAVAAAIGEPLLVLFSSFLLTDGLFLFCFLVGLLFAVRFLKIPSFFNAAVMGIALGVAALIRAVGEFFLLYVAVFALWRWLSSSADVRKLFLKGFATSAVLFILVLSPWIIRNISVFHTFGVSSEGPWALYFAYIPSLYSIDRGLSFPEAKALVKKRLFDKYPEKADQRMDPSLLIKESIPLLLGEWRGILKLQVINTLWFFTHDNYAYHLERFGILEKRPVLFSPTFILASQGVKGVPQIVAYLRDSYFIPIIGRVFWVIVSIFAFLGAWILIRKHSPAESRFIALFLLGTIMYFFILSSLIGLAGEGRIRMPVMPIMFLFAAVGIMRLRFIRAMVSAKYAKNDVEEMR